MRPSALQPHVSAHCWAQPKAVAATICFGLALKATLSNFSLAAEGWADFAMDNRILTSTVFGAILTEEITWKRFAAFAPEARLAMVMGDPSLAGFICASCEASGRQ